MAVHGKDATFGTDAAAKAGVVDLSAYVNEVSFDRNAETAETTTFGDDDKTYIPGLKDATLSVSGVWDATLDAHMDGILGVGALDWEYSPDGGTTTYSEGTSHDAEGGTVICTAYSPPSSVGDAVTWSAEFQISGTPARA